MGCQNSISKVGQQLKHLLEKFSRKYLANQIEIIKLILMLAELNFFYRKWTENCIRKFTLHSKL